MVSIITPCYNAEAYIAQSIQSVLNQTYQDWEMLIIDDCSTDKSPEIIKGFQNKDQRIRYFRTETTSGSPAKPRNIGLDNAKGEFVAFLDSDDIWFSDKLEKQVRFMTQHNYAVSYSFYEKMDWQGKRNNRVIKGFPMMTYKKLLKYTAMAFLTMMYRKDAIGSSRFKNIGHEDYNFYLDVLKKGYNSYNLGEVTALYREAKNSRSSNKFEMMKGHWNVIHNEQKTNTLKSIFYMMTYAFHGLVKFVK